MDVGPVVKSELGVCGKDGDDEDHDASGVEDRHHFDFHLEAELYRRAVSSLLMWNLI